MEVYDIETLRKMFLYLGYNIETGEWFEYEVSKYKNDIDALCKHLMDGNIKYGVSFNGLSFDSQVLQFILERHKYWIDLSNEEIVEVIYKFAQKLIDDQKYGLWAPYREEDLEVKQIDLFKIHHFDNENRRTSLKWLQFSMDFPNVEEMPIHHSVDKLTEEDITLIKEYCRNDILSTLQFYKYTIGVVEGDTVFEGYKGANKIQDRLDLIKEFGLEERAMNYSDVKIGDEINKKVYMDLSNKKPWELRDLKNARESTAGFSYGDCIPSYVKFSDPVMVDFFERMKEVRVNLNEKEEFPLDYRGTHYLIAKGGLHSNEKFRIVEALPGWRLRDADIGSQYPHSIIKRGLFPSHLGKLWLVGYTGNRDRRLEYKEKGKTSAIFKGLADMFKLALNGGGFGKTNERTNWQYDPFVQFSCTIGNQFEILMLIEMLEIAGIHVVSANTDGIVCLFPEELDKKYYEVCKEWEKIVGNDVQGKLEFTDYQRIVQSSVNDYLAITTKGKIKKKGDFATTYELNKNPSRRIIPIAIEKYFVEGIPIRKIIVEHKRIYDFCIGLKASKDYHYETISKEGKKGIYHRLVRYYISTDGDKLLKIKNLDSEADGNDISQCEAGEWRATIANKVDEKKSIYSYNIDYSYYIQKAEERIEAIEKGGKKKKIDPNQQKLF